MTPVPAVKDLLLKYGLSAKKSWGQNFLVDPHAYQAIVAATQATQADTVVEIGAGLGTLTAHLLNTGAKVIAVERERDMCAVLRAELAESAAAGCFVLREENALNLDVAALAAQHGPLIIAGNLPYQIASPLMFHFLESRSAIRRMIFMFQREVAERLLARPGSEDYSAMTAQVQMLARVQSVCRVGRGGFVPQPKVDSTVVLIEPRPTTLAPVRDLKLYSRVVKAAFGQRRKTLRNTMLFAFGPSGEAALRAAQIDPVRRGETLTVAEFALLANRLLDLNIDIDLPPAEPKPRATDHA